MIVRASSMVLNSSAFSICAVIFPIAVASPGDVYKRQLYLYVIEGETPYDIVKQFRKIIGRSYIPPKFAFGFGQSRWGYTTADDFRKAADGYRENNIPIDMVYMDICLLYTSSGH